MKILWETVRNRLVTIRSIAARHRGAIASIDTLNCAGLRNQKRKRRYTLLWIDDFEPGLEMYKAMFAALGYRVLTASSGAEGIQIAAASSVDIVITDYEMPEINGEFVAVAIKSIKPAVPVLMFSGSTLISARCRRVVDAFCDKAGSRDELLAAIHALLGKKRPVSLQPPVAGSASHHRQRTVAYSSRVVP
jgi:CheY-like chemotaxis protein